MKMLRSKLVLLMLLAASAALAESQPAKFEAVLTRIAKSEDVTITAAPTTGDVARWKAEARELDPEISLPAIVRLWVKGGQHDFVLLEWWRKRDNAWAGRMLMVALFECTGDEPTSAKPSFAVFAERFDEAEEKARRDELAYVVTHRRELARQLANLIKTTDAKFRSDEANEVLARYERMASKP